MKYFFLFLASLLWSSLIAQPQNSKWYFGAYAGLDFMTTPPTPLTNGAMQANFGCASQADAAGNLLFYTDGVTVYNASHVVMANGTGLLGNGSPVQPCLIVQKPGSPNLHYIFTVVGNGWAGGLNYSIVDMTLAAGLGSVTVKNYSLYTLPVDEKITGTLHCNGTDFWIVIHQFNFNAYRSYLLTASGVNTTAVVSTIGPINLDYNNKMKISPSGNKLATVTPTAAGPPPINEISLYDFDNTSGVVSNYQSLYSGLYSYTGGIEFSPDGSKLYCAEFGGNDAIHQWDLCAGTLPAVIASHYTVATSTQGGSYQLAINGKIYLSQSNSNSIGVINNPNNAGATCNYILSGQTLGGKFSTLGLPNFINRYKAIIPPFSYSLATNLACHAVSLTANPPVATCAASNYSVVSLAWNFGDPATGTLNVSNAASPVHIYSSSGTFTTTLIFYYKCSSDTLRQIVTVPPPDLSVSTSSSCINLSTATVAIIGGIGPYTYSWFPTSQTGSVVSNLSPGVYTVTGNDAGLACTVLSTISIATIVAPVMSLMPTSNVSICSGSFTTVQISGNVTSFSWTPLPGLSISNGTVSVNPTASQIYTIIGALNSCTSFTTLQVVVNPLPIPNITVNKNVHCLNNLLAMQGSGGNQYQWSGPNGFTSNQQQFSYTLTSIADAGIYTLTVTDQNGCKNATITNVSIVQSPGGELKGLKLKGCAPLCSDYRFERLPQQPSVLSTWKIDGNSFGERFTHCFTDGGNFEIKGTLIDTVTLCTAKISYSVNVIARPEADFTYSPDYPIADVEDVQFTNTSTGENQVWWAWAFNGVNTGPTARTAFGEHVHNHFDHAGIYVAALVVTNAQGCSDTIIKPVVINDDFALFVPNSFTPNGDLLNDVFLPTTTGVKTLTLKIFNRWGTKIFESRNPGEGWDGTYNGEAAQDGNYIWTITYTTDRAEGGKRRGQVLLKR